MLAEISTTTLPERLNTVLNLLNHVYFMFDQKTVDFNENKIFPQYEKILELEQEKRLAKFNLKKLTSDEVLVYQKLKQEYEIELWLNRVIVYFNTPKLNNKDHKQRNVCFEILEFLNELQKFSEDLKHALVTDQNALNVIIFTLSLSRDKGQWLKTLSLIEAYHKENRLLYSLLQWAYYTFVESEPTKAGEYRKIVLSKGSDLPDTPLTRIFTFIEDVNKALEYYKVIAPISEFLKNDSRPLVNIVSLTETLFKGGIALAYTANHQVVIDSYSNLLDIYFASYLSTPYDLLPKNGASFSVVFDYTLKFFIGRINLKNLFVEVEQLIKIIEKDPIRFICLNDLGRKRAVELAKQCFELRNYRLARDLYELVKVYDSETEQHKAHDNTFLFEFFYHMDVWLLSQGMALLDDKKQDQLVNNILRCPCCKDSDKIVLAEVIHDMLKELGVRTLELYKNAQSKQVKASCEAQFNRVMTLSKKSNMDVLSKKFQKVKEDLCVVKKQPIAIKKPIVFDFDDKASSKKKKSKPVKKMVMTDEWEDSDDVKPISPLKNHKVEVIEVPRERSSQPKFFNTLQRNIEHDKLFLPKSKLPPILFDCIKSIQKQVPDCEFFLTGGGVQSLIEQKIPNDYDVLMVVPNDSRCALDELRAILSRNAHVCEIRGKSHPIIYSVFKDTKIDMTLLFRRAKQKTEECLREDAFNRDFNICANIVSLNTEKDLLEVRSFIEVLNPNFQKSIKVIYKNPSAVFIDDPTRVFRLAHLILQYPEYGIDDSINVILIATREKWHAIFKSYGESISNKSRINHAVRKLFTRYNFDELTNIFYMLDVLNFVCKRSKRDMQQATEFISKDLDPKYRLLVWIMMSVGYKTKKNQKLQLPQIQDYCMWNNIEQNWIDFLLKKSSKPRGPKELVTIYNMLSEDVIEHSKTLSTSHHGMRK